MIYFHGIGEDLGLIDSEVSTLGEMLNMNVLAIEYPGYGINFHRGVTTQDEIVSDAHTVIEYLNKKLSIQMADMILFGRSMGSGVVIKVLESLEKQPAAAILASAY